ncbi:MAG: DNA-directed RNA polymerase subunit D [Candidatus Micrarchaeota archaeon]|nr:DNA-directed RNA polymerase subunit D [Candidatus Micrarchaeota archaeon]
MKISVIESNKSSLRFKLSGATYTTANALRRAMINSVPCLAIDNVTFYENSSTMMDEYVAHRIGQVPITTPKDYSEGDEVVFSLTAEGPGTVYSKALESNDKGIEVANERIPIMKLAENQRLRLDCKAVVKDATTNAKFQPGVVTYKMNAENEFEFYIETFGQMPPTEILGRAVNIISNNVKEVYKQMKK